MSVGVGGSPLRRNAPSVLNAAGHFAQFWDGRAATLEAQAVGPLFNPDEMGLVGEPELEATLRTLGYQAAFDAAFPGEGLSTGTAARALAAFQRTLSTPGPVDRFLAGDTAALSARQRDGYQRFLTLGCVTCHSGPLAGGGRFELLGDEIPWPSEADLGRFEVTGVAADRKVFKVASLRNVALTAPYFHDGSVPTLEEAVRLMGRHQLGLTLSDDDVATLADFLTAFTGERGPTSRQ